MNPPAGVSRARIAARHDLLKQLDTAFRQVELKSQELDGMDRFYARAYDMLRSPKAREAFDLSQERTETRSNRMMSLSASTARWASTL